MQIKKSREADLERKKPTFLLLGLAVACAAVLSAFEWRTSEELTSWEEDYGPEISTFEPEPIPISFREKKKPVVKASEPQKKIAAAIFDDILLVEDEPLPEDVFPDINWEPEPVIIEGVPEPAVEDEPILIPDVMPQFPGGEAARHEFLANHVSFTAMAKDAGISGKVYIEFTVGIDGTVKDIVLKKGLGAGLDQQALKAVEAMPNWEPGFVNGRPVSVRFVMPIHFNLRN